MSKLGSNIANQSYIIRSIARNSIELKKHSRKVKIDNALKLYSCNKKSIKNHLKLQVRPSPKHTHTQRRRKRGGAGVQPPPLNLTGVPTYPLHPPGRVAQSVGHPTHKSGVLGSIPGLATYFRFSFRFFKKGSCQLLAKVCARSTG